MNGKLNKYFLTPCFLRPKYFFLTYLQIELMYRFYISKQKLEPVYFL